MGKPRLELAGGLYHITARGNAQEPIFLDELDYVAFLRRLAKTVEAFRWLCHGYCLLPNHYHLLIETPLPNLGAGMLVLNGSYARRFNGRHERVGHVFQGPYRAELIQRDAHLLEVCRYIPLNPVRAGLCDDPAAWRWSSFRAICGDEHHPPYLRVDRVRHLFDTAERYRLFVTALATSRNQVARSARSVEHKGQRGPERVM